MITKCAACGKEFEVLYPELWAYKKYGKIFYCTWKCFRKKENEIMSKLTMEQKEKAVEIGIIGGDPVAYLKECGAANAPAAWYQIKKKLAEADPDKATELEKALHNKANREYKARQKVDKGMPKKLELEAGGNYEISAKEAMDNIQDAADEFFGKCEEAGLKVCGTVESFEDYIKNQLDAYEIAWIRHQDLGEWYYDKKFNSIDWRTPEGDEVSLPPAWWKQMIDELPRILRLLGVD